MRLVHRDEGGERVLAATVDVADSVLTRARGLMFRRSIPDDYALAFPFSRAAPRTLHMVCVPFPIDAVWVRDGRVTRAKRLRAWTGLGRGVADTVFELPAGAASPVDSGDELRLEAE